MNFLKAKQLLSLIILSSFFIMSPASFGAIQNTVQSESIQKKLAELEASSKGRIGIYAINTANNMRSSERFPTGYLI